MASTFGELLAEHEDFVSKQLAELRARLLAEHKRQVSVLWSQLEGASTASRGSIELLQSRGSIELLHEPHQAPAANGSSVISVHAPEPPSTRKQSCPHPPLDLHPATLGVIGESEELALAANEPLENCASFISMSSSDGGGLEVGCFDSLQAMDRGSVSSGPRRLSGGAGLVISRPVSRQAMAQGDDHNSKVGQPRTSIHVHYPNGESIEKAPTRDGSVDSKQNVKTLKSIDSIPIPDIEDSKTPKMERCISVASGHSDTRSVRSGMSAMSTMGRHLKHLHVVHAPSPFQLSPIHSTSNSRSASRMGGYASGYHSLAASAAASRRASVVSHASQFPMQLAAELQDEFNVDHYCTPVLRLSKGLQNDFGAAYGFGAHMLQHDDDDDSLADYDSDQEEHRDERKGNKNSQESHGINSYGLNSNYGMNSQGMKRMSSESLANSLPHSVGTHSRRLQSPDDDAVPHSNHQSIGSNVDLEANVRILPVWCIKKKSSRTQNSKRMPSAAHSVRSYTNTMSVFEQEAQAKHDRPYIIRPGSIHHVVWSFIGLVTIIYDCITMPLEVFDLSPSTLTTIIAWFIRIYWMVNVIVSFRTGFLTQKGTVEMGNRVIAMKYCRTWLPLDVFTIVLDWIDLLNDGKQGEIGDTARALRVLRTLRLARLVRAPEIAALVTDHLMDNSEQVILVAHIAKIMTVMVWVVHCIACFWYGITTFDENNGWARAEGILDLSVGRKYAWSFHWSLMAFFGNTLVFPTNLGERSFTILVLILAFLVSASFVSSMTTSMTRLQLISSQQSSQFAALRKYLHDHNITRPLAQRVMRNAQYAMVEMKRNAPESSIELLAICSVPLRIELHYEIHSRVILNHPFFYCYNAVNPAGMRQICHTAVSLLLLTTGDIIFTDCEVPAWPRMFFVVSGRFWYMQEGKKAKMEVESGQWFCEGVLWSFWMHRGTMVAADESQLLMVDAVKFQNIVGAFHTDHAKMYAAEYVKSMNMAKKHHFLGLTDIADTDEYIEERIVKVFQELNEEEEDDRSRTHSINNQHTDASHGAVSQASHQMSVSSLKFSLFKKKKPTVDRMSTGNSSVRSTGSGSDKCRQRRISTVRRSLEFLDKLKNDGTGSNQFIGNAGGPETKAQNFSVTSSLKSWGHTALACTRLNKNKVSPKKPTALEQIMKAKQAPDVIPMSPLMSPTVSDQPRKAPLKAPVEEATEQQEADASYGLAIVQTQSYDVYGGDVVRSSTGSDESALTGASNLEVKLVSIDARTFVNAQPSKDSA